MRPGFASVQVDGQNLGVTPLFRQPLKAGTHQLELSREDGTRRRQSLVVTANRETTLVVSW
ncbi:MAG: PEGA domain-containing protein [Archangiaceae bacterium]|nr:PEGA domain-containing protein [Archangiaceae bacterium]